MDMKAQGSRSGKALGIGKLLASACSAIVLRWIMDNHISEGARLEER